MSSRPTSRRRRRRSAALPLIALFSCAVAVAPPTRAQQPPKPSPPKPAAIPAAAPPVKLAPNVVARVNGQDITTDNLLGILQAFGGRPLVQNLVQATVIEQEAKRLGVVMTPAEVAAEVKKQKEAAVESNKLNTGTMMTWQQIAAREGVAEGYIEWNIRTGLLARKTFTKYIEKNVPGLDNQINLAHILIATVDLAPPAPGTPPKTPTPEEEKARDEAAMKQINQIRDDIAAKKITFEDAAKQHSADRSRDQNGRDVGSAPNGGVLGYAPRGAYDPAFETAGWKLEKVGDVTPTPVRSKYGYHLIKLVQRGKDAPAAEKTAYRKSRIDEQMGQVQQNPQILNSYINSLVQQAKVNYNPAPRIAAPPAKAATPAKAAAPARSAAAAGGKGRKP